MANEKANLSKLHMVMAHQIWEKACQTLALMDETVPEEIIIAAESARTFAWNLYVLVKQEVEGI